MYRKRIGTTLTVAGLSLLAAGVAVLMARPPEEGIAYAGWTCVTLGLALAGLGLGVLIRGRLRLTSALQIDFRRERPVFVLGLPFCRVRLTDQWRRRAYVLSDRHRLYLLISPLARIILLLMPSLALLEWLEPSRGWIQAGALSAGCFALLWFATGALQSKRPPAGESDASTAEPETPAS